MTILRNFFSSIISFFLIPAIVVLIFISSVTLVLFNTTTFNSVLKTTGAYQKVSDLVVQQAANQNASSDPVTQKVISEIAKRTITAKSQQLQSDLEKIVTSIHHFVVSDEKSFETRVNLVPYQAVLKEKLVEVFTSEYAGLPVCTTSQLKAMKATPTSEFPVCQQKGLDVNTLLTSSSFADTLAKFLPNTLIISEKGVKTDPVINLNLDGSSTTPANADQNTSKTGFIDAQNKVKSTRSFQNFLLIGVIVLGILLIASRLKNYISSLEWVAVALFSGSILPLIFSFAAIYFLKPEMLKQALVQILGSQTESQVQPYLFITDSLFLFVQKIMENVRLESVIIVALAIIIFVGTKYLAWSKSRKEVLTKEPIK